MRWLRNTFVLVLLGAALSPAPALGDGIAADSIAAPEPPPVAAGSGGSGGYVFPSPRDQFSDWGWNTFGPSAIAGSLVGASWRQWVTDEPAEWDQDPHGFAQRFGTGALTTGISETSLAVISAALAQDVRYYRSPRAGLAPRARHALAMTFLARDRSGRAVFSPGKTLAPFVGPLVVQTTLYPDRYDAGDALLSGVYSLAINAGWNALREFVLQSPPWSPAGLPAY